jgi:hypothetical protein
MPDNLPIDWLKPASELSQAEYDTARRFIARGGRPPSPAEAMKQRIAREVVEAEAAREVPPPSQNTGSTLPPPPAKDPNGGRGAMDLSESDYRSARLAIVIAADRRDPGTYTPLTAR